MESTTKQKEEYYDSDIASINQDDFLSDNQPPQEVEGERRIIKKQKMSRIYKSIYRLGHFVDKPAPYDLVTLRYKRFDTKPDTFYRQGNFITYNLGLDSQHSQIQHLVTSMSSNEASLFEIQTLKMCDKTNIKVLDHTTYYVIDLKQYNTVIDLDGDRVFMKEIEAKGTGHFRVSECDEVIWSYTIRCGDHLVTQNYQKPIMITEKFIWDLPRSVWRMLQTMKNKQISVFEFDYQTFQKVQGTDFRDQIAQNNQKDKIVVRVVVDQLIKVDNILFNQKLLKKTIRKGNSTSKASDGSKVYYAVGFYDNEGNLIKQDPAFSLNTDALEQLQKIECRTHYLDEQKSSQMLKHILTRVKPLEIAQFRCYDKQLISYGWDKQQLISLFKEVPDVVYMKIKMFNFTDQKTAYNTNIQQKLSNCARKKPIGIKYIQKGDYTKAKQIFESMVAFFDSGIETEEDKKQVQAVKLSSLMNCSLCGLKLQNYDLVLDMCQRAKQIKNSDKCVYRLALAYKKKGEAQKGLDQLSQWKKDNPLNQQMESLKIQLEADLQKYNKNSKKMYENMFG